MTYRKLMRWIAMAALAAVVGAGTTGCVLVIPVHDGEKRHHNHDGDHDDDKDDDEA